MSGKRSAAYSIDPNTLQQTERNPQQQQSNLIPEEDVNKKQNRKIFKIKRSDAVDNIQNKQTKVSFKLSSSQQYKNPDQKDQQATKKQTIVQNPFQNLFKHNQFNGIGIFSNIKSMNLFKTNEKNQSNIQTHNNIKNQQTNIFSTLNKGTSIFSNNNASLIKNTSASLFSKNLGTSTPNNIHEQQGSGDSAQLQNQQNIQTNPNKSATTYKYGESCPILLTLKAAKFKKRGHEMIQNVQIVLQQDNQNSMKYLTVRIPATKKSIYSGILVENRSELKHFNGKKQNVQVSIFSKQKQAICRYVLMFQFNKQEQGEMLYQRINELLKKSQKISKEENSKRKTQQND